MEEQVQKSSVELTRNAKGDTQFTVKARHEDVEVAGMMAEDEYKRLCDVFQVKQ